MKRTNQLFDEIVSFENLLAASRKARKGKRHKASTASFEHRLESNLFRMMEVLEDKTYEPGGYFDFLIHDPKKRVISAAPYFDRVVHHGVMNVLEPVLGNSFIHDTYACIKGRGTHKAVERYKEFMRKSPFVLKCDIRKYFESVDLGILMQKIVKKIKCEDTLWLLEKVVFSRDVKGGDEYFPGDDLFTPFQRKRGIPIGNLTSQFFANLYLNDFDHFVKEELRVKHYIRYCDDFVLFGKSKPELREVKMKIVAYLETIRLRLHENKSRVYRVTDGVDFLGYRMFPHHTLVRKKVVKRFRKKLQKRVSDYKEGKIGLDKVRTSIHSWIGHVGHANSYNLRKEVFGRVVI